jgi:selenocysteine-specific elongation factor
LVHNASVSFHAGSAETPARVGLLDRRTVEPGDAAWAQIRLQDPLALAKGDLFIIRWLSPSATMGGGTIVEPHPRRHRRFQEKVLSQLAVLEQGTPEEILLEQLSAREPTEVEALVRRSGLPGEAARVAVGELVERGKIVALDGQTRSMNAQTFLVSAAGWERLVERVSASLAAHHKTYPLRPGMAKEELRTRLGVESRLFQRLLQRLLAEERVAESGPLVRLAAHSVAFSPEQERQARQVLELLRRYGTAPPDRVELEAALGVSPELTQALLDRRELVEVSEDLLYPREVYTGMVDQVVDTIKKKGPITVAAVRDIFGTSRKFALALMAHLDERKITRRVGDERVLQ